LIINMRHFAINVTDIDRSKALFLKMGASLESEDMESGKFIDGLLELDKSIVRTCKLRLMDGSRIELMQFISPPPEPTAPVDFRSKVKLGLHHIAFTVTDINLAISLVVESGGQLIGGPLEPTKAHSTHAVPALHAYCFDSMGNIIHLAQDRRPRDQGALSA